MYGWIATPVSYCAVKVAVLVLPDAIMIELVPAVPLKARMPVEPTAVQPTGAGELMGRGVLERAGVADVIQRSDESPVRRFAQLQVRPRRRGANKIAFQRNKKPGGAMYGQHRQNSMQAEAERGDLWPESPLISRDGCR